uniref:Chaperone DnaJ C-terminal domain-containing protein n=1 Tax=Euplotes harpa TaxID=151035 RepID=A0A7S3JAJ1_9SPIT|mmetsp:Transcript_2641/g.3373  ORF Transcript_2641/g.3373 Transcript_2641/m.3373 type:complete len:180 (+) Transcript_2641:506-1045(+)
MQMKMQTPCPHCGGKGVMSANKCNKCHGKKVNPESKTLHVVVTPGMQNGEKVIFEKDGPQQPDVIPGDVVVILKQSKHDQFNRVGDDLYTEMMITFKEAMMGFKKPLKHLDGRKIEVRSEPQEIIQPFSWKIIENEGMPLKDNPTQKGKLHIKFIVSLPDQLTPEQKELVKEMLKEEKE